MAEAVLVVGAGVVTSIGLSLAETAMSARARIARQRAIEWRDRRCERFIVAVVPDEGLPPLDAAFAGEHLQYREARMLRLGHVALAETLAALPAGVRVPLLLGLPEHHTTQPLRPPQFLSRLARQAGIPIDIAASVAVARGRAAGLAAVRQACARITRGEAEFVLVGGVDSLVDLYVLGTLDLEGRIRGDTVSDGFTPGEGAGFALLASRRAAERHALAPLAQVLGSGFGQEPGHLYAAAPYLGEGLAAAFAALFAEAPPPAPIGCVYASFNGERYWGREFGTAFLRNRAAFAEDHQMEHPAEGFGDLGAAHGAVMFALAAHGLRHGYRRGPVLVYASSDHEDRATTLLGRLG